MRYKWWTIANRWGVQGNARFYKKSEENSSIADSVTDGVELKRKVGEITDLARVAENYFATKWIGSAKQGALVENQSKGGLWALSTDLGGSIKPTWSQQKDWDIILI